VPRNTALAARQDQAASAAGRSASRAVSAESQAERGGSRPLRVFHCTAGSEGKVAHEIIVSHGSGRRSNIPWQSSSTQTRTAKSDSGERCLASAAWISRSTTFSRRIDTPAGESDPS